MSYPLFQNALRDSTPFSGTMADTSTPTPEGQQTQVSVTPQATESPGPSGNQERLRKISEDRGLIQQQLRILSTMRYVSADHWKDAANLALTGKDMEPAGMLYKRHEAMQGLLKMDAQFAQEERLLTTQSPQQQVATNAATDRERRAAEMNFLDKFNSERGLPPVPQEIQIQYIEKGNSLNEAVRKAGGSDEVKGLINAATLGSKVGPEGAGTLGLTGSQATAAAAGAKYGEKIRASKASGASGGLPVLGLFKAPNQLYSAMRQDFNQTVKQEQYLKLHKYKVPDSMNPTVMVDKERYIRHKDGDREARADVAARWPGYEKYFPNFVEKGFTDVPAVDPGQDDVKTQRQQLKEQVGKKAQ